MDKNEKLRLIRERKKLKRKRPPFKRYESWRYKKLKKSGWRRQRGIDDKTRRKTKTGVKSPSVGYRTPKKIRGLHPSGLEDVLVTHVHELEELDPDVHGIRVVSRLGLKKRATLIETAQEQGFRVLNIGLSKEDQLEIEEFEEELEEELDLDGELEEELDEDEFDDEMEEDE